MEEREKMRLGGRGSNVSRKADLCDVVDHGLGWGMFLSMFSISLKFKQNRVPQFPHQPNKVHGIVCPCYAALELSNRNVLLIKCRGGRREVRPAERGLPSSSQEK